MKYTFDTTYQIGDPIFHATKESDQGIIIDISYSIRNKSVKYNVVFGRMPDDDIWCYEEELSESKVF